MENYNLKDYREAKIVLPHINAILRVIDLSTRSLEHFKSYLPVIKILKVMEEQRALLDTHKTHYDKILKARGKI